MAYIQFFSRGDLVRDEESKWLGEVVDFLDNGVLKLRRLSDGTTFYQKEHHCRPIDISGTRISSKDRDP
jgi:hypothetical protein